MALIKISTFRRRYWKIGEEPTMATVRRWIDRGELPGGRKFGSSYYVDEEAFQAANTDRYQAAKSDPLVAKVLNG